MSESKVKTFGDLKVGDRFADSNGAIYTVAGLLRENGRTQVEQQVKYDVYAGPIFARAWANDADKIDAWRP